MASTAPPNDPVPSPSYAFEPEFTGHPPRQIPDRLNEGPYPRGQRTRAVVLTVAGVLCLLLSRAPGIDVLALYVLPLGYLNSLRDRQAVAYVREGRLGWPWVETVTTP